MKDLRVIIYLLSHEVQSALHRVGHLDLPVSIIDLHASSTEEEEDKHQNKNMAINLTLLSTTFLSVSLLNPEKLSLRQACLVQSQKESVWSTSKVNLFGNALVSRGLARNKYWETAVRWWCLHHKAVQVGQSDGIQSHKGPNRLQNRNEACMTS